MVIAWVVTGPFYGLSDTWQLVINTGTTVVTFLMVFLIQNAQYRDAEAVQMKLDELLRVTHGAHNALLDIEELEEDELHRIRQGYTELAESAREKLRRHNRQRTRSERWPVSGHRLAKSCQSSRRCPATSRQRHRSFPQRGQAFLGLIA